MRVAAQHPFRLAHPHFVEEGERAPARLPGRAPFPHPEPVRQLRLDAPARVQGRQRILWDQGDLGAEQGPAAGGVERRDLGPGQDHGARRHPHGAGKDPQDRAGDGGFAGAALAHETVDLARSDRKGHVAEDGRAAVAIRDRGQVLDREQRVGHRRITGSKARRRPSPNPLKASTVAKTATSGAAKTHQAW